MSQGLPILNSAVLTDILQPTYIWTENNFEDINWKHHLRSITLNIMHEQQWGGTVSVSVHTARHRVWLVVTEWKLYVSNCMYIYENHGCVLEAWVALYTEIWTSRRLSQPAQSSFNRESVHNQLCKLCAIRCTNITSFSPNEIGLADSTIFSLRDLLPELHPPYRYTIWTELRN